MSNIFLNQQSEAKLSPYLSSVSGIADDDTAGIDWLTRKLTENKTKLAVTYSPASISTSISCLEDGTQEIITIDLWACEKFFSMRGLEISAIILHECGHLLNPVKDTASMSSLEKTTQSEFQADDFVLKFPRMKLHLRKSIQKLIDKSQLFEAYQSSMFLSRIRRLEEL